MKELEKIIDELGICFGQRVSELYIDMGVFLIEKIIDTPIDESILLDHFCCENTN